MSFTTGVIKTAIKCTPNMMIVWVANKILKGIVELSDISFDLDTRTAYVQATLYGETEPIEVWLDGYAIISDRETKKLFLQEGRSNRPWLNNIFSHITGKGWKIPALPQYEAYIELLAELLKQENSGSQEA